MKKLEVPKADRYIRKRLPKWMFLLTSKVPDFPHTSLGGKLGLSILTGRAPASSCDSSTV